MLGYLCGRSCRASHVSTIVWGFGKVKHLPDINLMQELTNVAMLKNDQFTAMVSALCLLANCLTALTAITCA